MIWQLGKTNPSPYALESSFAPQGEEMPEDFQSQKYLRSSQFSHVKNRFGLILSALPSTSSRVDFFAQTSPVTKVETQNECQEDVITFNVLFDQLVDWNIKQNGDEYRFVCPKNAIVNEVVIPGFGVLSVKPGAVITAEVVGFDLQNFRLVGCDFQNSTVDRLPIPFIKDYADLYPLKSPITIEFDADGRLQCFAIEKPDYISAESSAYDLHVGFSHLQYFVNEDKSSLLLLKHLPENVDFTMPNGQIVTVAKGENVEARYNADGDITSFKTTGCILVEKDGTSRIRAYSYAAEDLG